jgi:Domain of unknown function (DUF4157)
VNATSLSNVGGVRAQLPAAPAVLVPAPSVSHSAPEAPQGLTAARLAPSRIPADMSGASVAPAVRMQRRPSQVPAHLFRSDGAEMHEKTSSVLDMVGMGGGQLLPSDVRADMEAGLGADLSDVRIHTGERAAASAEAVGAAAYTVGNDIVFGVGSYSPGTDEGRRVLAHELAHVQQQRSGPVSGTDAGWGVAVSDPGDSFEREAESTASRLISARSPRAVPGAASPRPAVQRGAASPVVQRALPVAAEVLEIALTATITVQEQAALTQGGLRYQSDKGSRHGDPPQPVDQDYRAMVIHAERRHHIFPNVRASFYVHWQGNKFGEMGGAYVQLSLDESTEFREHGSSLNVEFTVLDTMPKKGDDPRLWSMQWIYEGNFDPYGPGQYAFQGRFEIDAFGGFRVLEHRVRDDSTFIYIGDPAEDYVSHGDNIASATPPPLPPKAKAATPNPPKK